MKFKLIFILFNSIVIFSFLFISFLPILMLGWEFALPFWQRSWYLLLVFLTILASLDVYFIRNWKLFSLLEQQKWDDIRRLIEDDFASRGRINEQRLQILLSIYLQNMSPKALVELASSFREKRPRLFSRHQLDIGVGYLMTNDYQGMREYYAGDIGAEISNRPWIDWYWSFASLKTDGREEGITRMKMVFDKASDPLLVVLSAYILFRDFSTPDVADKEVISRLASKYNLDSLLKLIQKSSKEIHIRAMAGVIEQAANWFFTELHTGPSIAQSTQNPEDMVNMPVADPMNDKGGSNDS